jgi:antitoxin (DNA-binding transcriptional repressor) of toxin-antitoxin stability system
MTIITGREFRSNQNKYIGMAHRGERVVISSKSGYAELTPVSKEDKEVKEHLNAKAFLAVSSRIREEVKEGKKLMFHNVDELRAHLATL